MVEGFVMAVIVMVVVVVDCNLLLLLQMALDRANQHVPGSALVYQAAAVRC